MARNFKRILHGLILVYLMLALISPFFLGVKAGSTTVTLTATDDAFVDSSGSNNNYGSYNKGAYNFADSPIPAQTRNTSNLLTLPF